jgi:hypothetical protein
MLLRKNGVLTVPVVINDRITLDFFLDSGASDVSVPADVAMTLIRTGTIGHDDSATLEHGRRKRVGL